MLSAIASLLRARLDARRPADEKRHPDRLLVHEPLVEQAVVAEEESLVARVDDDRVSGEPGLVEDTRAPCRRCRPPTAPWRGSPACSAGTSSARAPRRSASRCLPSRTIVTESGLIAQPPRQLRPAEARRRRQLQVAVGQVGRDALLVLVQRIGARRVRIPERDRLGNPLRREVRARARRRAPTADAAPCDASSGRTACRADGCSTNSSARSVMTSVTYRPV